MSTIVYSPALAGSSLIVASSWPSSSLLASLAVYVPSAIAVVLSVIGVAWLLLLLYSIAQSETKQGLHDRYARSIVVRTRRRTA